jgi:hypothetical protein
MPGRAGSIHDWRALGIRCWPTIVVIDRDGAIDRVGMGAV